MRILGVRVCAQLFKKKMRLLFYVHVSAIEYYMYFVALSLSMLRNIKYGRQRHQRIAIRAIEYVIIKMLTSKNNNLKIFTNPRSIC
jgi:hypothetical protein